MSSRAYVHDRGSYKRLSPLGGTKVALHLRPFSELEALRRNICVYLADNIDGVSVDAMKDRFTTLRTARSSIGLLLADMVARGDLIRTRDELCRLAVDKWIETVAS